MCAAQLEDLEPAFRALIVLGGLLLLVAIGEATGSPWGCRSGSGSAACSPTSIPSQAPASASPRASW